MDSGLVTSERGPHRRDTVVGIMSPTSKQSESMMMAGPSVTCRQCRVQILLDDMETHECDPKDPKVAPATHSPRGQTALATAATRASSFLDSFLDTSPPKAVETPTMTAKAATSQKTSESLSMAKPKEQQTPARAVEVTTPAPVSPSKSAALSHEAIAFETKPSLVPAPQLQNETLLRSHSRLTSSSTHSESTTSADWLSPTPPQQPPHRSPSRLLRSLSVAESPPSSVPVAPSLFARVLSTADGSASAASPSLVTPFQSRVRGVRFNKGKVAVYAIVSNLASPLGADPHANASSSTNPPSAASREILVERRYREFYAFALAVYSMFPSQELWQRLPPKTLCLPTSRNQSGGFLLRRKNGLDDFMRHALELMDLRSTSTTNNAVSRGSIGQWYLVRKFLTLPPANVTGANQPTKDRNLVLAMHELKINALEPSTEWTAVGRVDDHDATYEKLSDGFHMVKRVKMCAFPARAVFDMITKRTGSKPTPATSVTVADGTTGDSGGTVPGDDVLEAPVAAAWDPLVESVEILRRENRQTWTERVVYKGGWASRKLEMISLKTWKVDETGSIVIVMIPADDAECTRSGAETTSNAISRVDCILGGWVITPIHGEDTCSVTWLMQANFGSECDSRREFTGSQSFSTAFMARSCLLSWANGELAHLLQTLESTYDPTYYRKLGPLLSGGDFHKLKLERRDTMSARIDEDPRVYVLAHELEPAMCLLIHKSTNTNALIFRTHARRAVDKQQQQRQQLELDIETPLKAEWIMFEKVGNPRQDLSAIERSTTYPFSIRHVGSDVFQFTLELLRRDCVLRNDPEHGFALFTTINGKPNTLLKRVYLSYSKQASRLSFGSKLEEIHLFGTSEREVMSIGSLTPQPTGAK